jgi:hypothetical protein
MPYPNDLAFTPQDTEVPLIFIGLIEIDQPVCMPRSGAQRLGPSLVENGASTSPCDLLSTVCANERVDDRMPKRSEYSALLGGHEHDPSTTVKADALNQKIANARYQFI